jgi:protein TonB
MNIFGKNWDDPIAQERLEIVFENRNHDYGAYLIRRRYNRTILFAFFSTLTFAMLLALTPTILAWIYPEKISTGERVREVVVELLNVDSQEEIYQEKKDLHKEEFKSKTTPSGPTEQFTNLKVSDTDSSNMKTQDQLSNTVVATKTNKSDSTNTTEPLPATKPSGGGQEVIKWAEVMPSFVGGEEAMMDYLRKTIKFPAAAREEGITGTVYVKFVVNKSGEVVNVELLRGIGGGCEEVAIKAIRNMPKWNPGMQNGEPVNVQYNLPISFQLH